MAAHHWDVHYQSHTPPWETGHPSAELARVVKEDRIVPGRVLEVGCGSGINAVWLAEQGFDVTAVDFNELAIAKARTRAAAAKVRVHFEVADVLDLPALNRQAGSAWSAPFPFFFDRGCYHSVRPEGAAAYAQSLARVTAPG